MRLLTLASGFFVSGMTFAQAMPCMTYMGCPRPRLRLVRAFLSRWPPPRCCAA